MKTCHIGRTSIATDEQNNSRGMKIDGFKKKSGKFYHFKIPSCLY